MPTSLRRRGALLLLPVLLLGAACGGDDGGDTAASTPDDGATTTALPTEIPAGTTLRIGDQLNYLQTVLDLGGEDEAFPYTIEYSAFIGGPPLLQAFQGGALDAGFVGSTPLIFAQAADQDLVAVAGWGNESGGYDLVVPPGSDVESWEDLEGAKVAYQQGTASEAALLQALDAEDLALEDVTPVLLPLTQTAAALQSGDADAGVLIEPLTSAYINANPGSKVVDVAEVITDRSSFVITNEGTLGDPAKTAALADYISRLVRSFTRIAADPSQLAEAVYVKTYGLTPERAQELIERNGAVGIRDLPDDLLEAQQALADLFVAAGEIPEELDVREQFDTRFAQVVADAVAAVEAEPAP